jgi:hypothetical protein
VRQDGIHRRRPVSSFDADIQVQTVTRYGDVRHGGQAAEVVGLEDQAVESGVLDRQGQRTRRRSGSNTVSARWPGRAAALPATGASLSELSRGWRAKAVASSAIPRLDDEVVVNIEGGQADEPEYR